MRDCGRGGPVTVNSAIETVNLVLTNYQNVPVYKIPVRNMIIEVGLPPTFMRHPFTGLRVRNISMLLAAAVLAPIAEGAVLWKDGSTDNLNLVTSWWTAEAGTTDPAAIVAADALRFGGSGQGASNTYNLGDNLSVGGIKLDNQTGTPNYNVTINGSVGQVLTLNGASTADIGYATAGIVLNGAAGGSLTINADIALGAAQQWVTSRTLTVNGAVNLGASRNLSFNTAGSSTLTISGIISGTGTSGLIKTAGAGTLAISNIANTFGGQVSLVGGTTSVTKLANIGENSSFGTGSSASQIIINGAALTHVGSETSSTNRQLSFNGGNNTINSNGSGTLSFTAASIANAGNAARTLTLGGTNTGDNTFGSIINNSTGFVTGLIKSGAGKWVLTGNNSYTGSTTINAGILSVTGSGVLGGAAGSTNNDNGNIVFGSGSLGAVLQFESAAQLGVASEIRFRNTSGPLPGQGGRIEFIGTTNQVVSKNLQSDSSAGVRLSSNSVGGNLVMSGNWTNVTNTRQVFLEGTGTGLNEISGAMNTGAITKRDAGTWLLSGNNSSLSTAVTVSGGTLMLGNANALGTTASGTTVSTLGVLDLNGQTIGAEALNLSGTGISSGGALINSSVSAASISGAVTLGANASIGGSGNLTLSGAVGGAFALTKVGAGTLTLSGANSYTLGTTISAGTLALGASNVLYDSGSVTINGGSLALGANSDTIGSVVLSAGTITGSGTLTVSSLLVSNAAASSISANVAGSGGLTKSGSGDLTLSGTNTYTGATTVSNGKLIIAAGASIASSSIALGNSTELQTVDGLTLSSGRSLSLGSGISVVSATHTGNLTLSGGSITIGFGASEHDVLAVIGDLSLASGSLNFSSVAAFATGYYNLLTYTGVYTAPTNLSDITLVGLSSDGTSRQTFSLFHDAATSAIQLNVGGQAQTVNWNGTNGSTWDAGVAAAENWTVTSTYSGDQPNRFFNSDAVIFADGASTGNIMIGAANVEPASISITSDSLDYTIGSSGGGKIASGSISKSGASALTLSIANTFNGGTTLNAGRLRLGADGAAGTGLLTINGGRLSAVGSTARLIANNVLFASDVTIGDATDNGILTLSGILDLNGVSRTLTLDSDIIVSGSLSNGSLTKAGNGTLTLSNANTLTNTTISAGTVVATNASALGTTGTVTLNDAATGSANASLLIGNVSLGRAITVANEGGGAVTLGASGAVALPTFTGVITLAKDVTLNGGSNTDRLTFSGGIGGTGNVTVAGTGRVVFTTATNAFNGNLTVNSGSILQLSDGTGTATSFIPDAGLLTVNGTLKLAKGANSETVGGLAGSGEVRGHEGVASTASSLVINTSGTYTFSGILSNGGATGSTLSLTKSGTGTQNLTGSNATIYTGTTTVSDGTLGFANGVVLTGNATVNGGRLVFNANSTLGAGLISSASLGEVSFGANTLIIGNATASNQFYFGKITGTGTLQLRGGSLTVQNSDGTTTGTGSNFQIWTAATSVIQSKENQFFALDTGSTLTNRKDFGFINETGDALNLSALSGYGAIRNDAGGASVRRIVVDQAIDTVFNGALLSHRSSTNVQRALSLTKQGNGTLELAGFVGKATASSTAGSAGGVALTVEGGVLNVTNAYNTTTTNTDAIGLGLVTVTGGTLGFSNQALLNTAGSAGATRIDLNGGILRWNTGNTQDLSAGGRLKINDGVVGQFNTNGNDVALASAFALGASGTAGLTKIGNGTLTLSATNTYSGVTTVSSGTLAAGNSGAFGSSTISVSGGILNLGGYAVNNAITLNSGSITGGTSFTGSILLNAATLTLGSASDFGTGTITVGTGSTLDLNSWNPSNSINLAGGQLSNSGNWNGAVILSGSADATLINTLTLNTVRVVAGSTVDLAGVSKGITFEGGTLSNLSTYSGTLTVKTALDLTAGSTAGALRLEDGGSINYGSRASTDTIQYVGGSLTNAGNYTGDLNVVGTSLALTAGNLGAGRVVTGTGTSVTIGTGFSNAIRLTGGSITGSTLNNYNGTVTVASGQILDLDGASNNLTISNADANITLETGATLKGSASVGDITVEAGGILAPGNSPGTITASSLTLNGGSSMNFEVAASTDFLGFDSATAGTDYDTIIVTNLLDLSALSFETRFNLNLLSVGDGFYGDPHGWDANTPASFVLFTYGTLNLGDNESLTSLFNINTTGFYGTDGVSVLANHFSITNDIGAKQIMLNYSAVPEPSTYGMILGGLALAAAAIRRRRQTKA